MKVSPNRWPYQTALMIVAHPDDETLWAGGTLLLHPETQWTVVTLCRGHDPDRAPRFKHALEILGASGTMGHLDDGPEQTPLQATEVQDAVLALTDGGGTDLILTHSEAGEYTRHRRHEETGAAVLALWEAGQIRSRELWAFAYRDTNPQKNVRAITEADVFIELPVDIWKRKRALITETYGFDPDSFEANAALRTEAFWRLHSIKR